MLLAEELALVALDPQSGRHSLGTRSELNCCLAGLLIAELQLDDRPESPVLSAAADVVAEHGPKTKTALSAMDRGLDRRLGMGTWDAVIAELASAGIVSTPTGGLRPRTTVEDPAVRDAIVARLRSAATSDDPLEVRTALLLSMTGPAQLLEIVAPDRSTRRHARQRIDHALDTDALQPIAESVRKVLADAQAAVIAVTVAASVTTHG